MVISSKPRDKAPKLFLSAWASSARTGLAGMGDRSDRSNLSWWFWAPQHLNHSLFSPHPLPHPHRAQLELRLSPSHFLPQTLNPKSFLSTGFQGRGGLNRRGGSSSPRFHPWVAGDSSFSWGGAHSRYFCLGWSIFFSRRF